MQAICHCPTKLGCLRIVANDRGITQIALVDAKPMQETEVANQWTQEAVRQIREYLDGRRTTFTVPLDPTGTPFQKQVWKALVEIPYGETRSYRDIAKQVGNPNACRAVGMANHRNPILLMIPCHRVIGASGKLTGYAAGLDKKEYLLRLEQETKRQTGKPQ